MKAQFNRLRRRICRKPLFQTRLDVRPKAEPPDQHEETIQLVYAYLPPVVVLATEHHLRVQTNIEQRAHQIWFAQGCQPGGPLGDWIQAECEVVHNLCQALLGRNTQESEPDRVSQ